MGRQLISLGISPGPQMNPILKQAFEAQLDGEFSDEEGAILWAKAHLGN
ncbi:MAG: hypothetical protein IJJ26_06325 [Victivallales bacterium]|nr:hypothetical protein [Victivallales bacterium]